MNNLFKNPLVVLASVGVLSACGGGTTATTTYYELLDASGGTFTVAVIAQDSGSPIGTTTESGSYNIATGVTVGGGTHSLDATSVLSNDRSSTAYSYVSGLTSAAGDYKIVGVVTDAGDLPSDTTVVYLGQAQVLVNDGVIYEGTMESTITATIGTVGTNTNLVDVELRNISDGLRALATYGAGGLGNGNELIQFTDLEISGSTFSAVASSGSVVDGFGSAAASIDTSSATLTASGFFAGSTGQEVAGGATMDTAAAQALITFTGTQ